jgi:BirA family biotin operon repressor/biotin-[acetyl-CoA-carboxylase] ligase
MDQARILAEEGAPERTVVVSDEQTQGRGRSERSWHSPSGAGLYCTLLLRPTVTPDHLSTLPLVIGVGVAQAIESLTGHEARLKWPNDVWLTRGADEGKVAGVLTTSRLRGHEIDVVLVGIGVNVATPEADLPSGATSLLAATGAQVAITDLLLALLSQIDGVYASFLEANGRPSLEAYRRRAAMLGEQVHIEQQGSRLEGRYVGVDDNGALLLAQDGRPPLRIVAGDLVRGPRLVNR